MRQIHRVLYAFSAFSALSALFAVSPACAEVISASSGISLRMTGFSNGSASVNTSLNSGYIGAGRLQGIWTQNGSSRSFLTYCTDIFQSFSWDTNYSYSLVGTGTAYGFTSRQEDLMGKLFTLAGAAVNNTDSSAAFQLATWEIVNESATGLSLDSGVFRVELGGNSIQRQLANGWLTAVLEAGAQKTFSATRLYSSVAQDFVVFNSSLPDRPASLPEPGNLALATLALLGLLATRRRNRHIPAG